MRERESRDSFADVSEFGRNASLEDARRRARVDLHRPDDVFDARHHRVVRAERQQRPQGRARPSLGPRLQIAPEQDERGDRGRDLQIEVT